MNRQPCYWESREAPNTISGFIPGWPGIKIGPVNDVREIKLVSGIPAGGYVGKTSAHTCRSAMVPDPNGGVISPKENFFTQIFCDGDYIKAVQMRVNLYEGNAYLEAKQTFFRHTSDLPETAAVLDPGKLFRDKSGTQSVATTDTANGYGGAVSSRHIYAPWLVCYIVHHQSKTRIHVSRSLTLSRANSSGIRQRPWNSASKTCRGRCRRRR